MQVAHEANKVCGDMVQTKIRTRIFGMLEGLETEALSVQQVICHWDTWVEDLKKDLDAERWEILV